VHALPLPAVARTAHGRGPNGRTLDRVTLWGTPPNPKRSAYSELIHPSTITIMVSRAEWLGVVAARFADRFSIWSSRLPTRDGLGARTEALSCRDLNYQPNSKHY